MRVLFVAPYVPSLVRIRSFSFVKYLSRRHEVTVVALMHDKVDAEAVDFLRHYCTRVETIPLSRGEGLYNCGLALPSRVPLQAAYCRSGELTRRIASELQHGDYDLAHVEHMRAAHFGLQITGIPVVYDSVDCITLLLRRTVRHSRFGPGKALSWSELRRTVGYEADLVGRFDRVLVTSDDDRRMLLNLRGNTDVFKVVVVPNGVHLARSSSDAGKRDPDSIVFSGKMSYHANVDAVTYFCHEIFPLVKRDRPRVRLTIVGSNPPPEVRRLGKDPSVTVTGHVPDVRPFLEHATVAVCPVRYAVGIQNKVLEAMATGTPVVATSQACKALQAKPGQDLLSADDSRGFAAHVLRLLEQPAYADWIANNGRRYVVENHEWSRIVERVESIYEEVVAGHRRLRIQTPLEMKATPI